MSIIPLIKIEIDEKIKIKITYYFHMTLIKVFFLFSKFSFRFFPNFHSCIVYK